MTYQERVLRKRLAEGWGTPEADLVRLLLAELERTRAGIAADRAADADPIDDALALIARAAGAIRTDPDRAERLLREASVGLEAISPACPACGQTLSVWCRRCAGASDYRRGVNRPRT